MKRMKAPAFRVVAPLTLALLLAATPQIPPPGAPVQAPAPLAAPLAGDDPPPLTPVLDPAPREPRPELRIAQGATALRGNS